MDEKTIDLRIEATKIIKILYDLECNSSESSGVFTNKYKIRGLLTGFAERAKCMRSVENLEATALWGFFTVKLANNYLETEEPCVEAKSRLTDVVNYLHNNLDLSNCDVILKLSGLLLYTYNSMAVACDPQGKLGMDTSFYWLELAQNLYKKRTEVGGDSKYPDCWESLALLGSNEKLDSLVKNVVFENGYTTTLFMLAQVQSNNGDKSMSAESCCETLCRQLHFRKIVHTTLNIFQTLRPTSTNTSQDASPKETIGVQPMDWLADALRQFDSQDWAKNASNLSEFYVANENYAKALECLLVSKTVLTQTNESSHHPVGGADWDVTKTKTWADHSRLTANFSLRLLEAGSKSLIGSRFDADPPPQVPLQEGTQFGTLFHEDCTVALFEAYGESNDQSMIADALHALTTPPRGLQAAVRLFQWTSRSLSEASKYYTLEEHCSEAIELIRAHARAYEFLTTFEPDLQRKCCMQKRRIRLLENLLNQLNPQFYMTTCREVMFECADALTALRELNEEKMRTKSPNSSKSGTSSTQLECQAQKTNRLARDALNMYNRLLMSFRKPIDQSEPRFYEGEWLKTVLLAHFYSARLHSKILTGSKGCRARQLQLALEEYKTMVDLADRHTTTESGGGMPTEVGIAREMIQLLPAQILRLSSLS